MMSGSGSLLYFHIGVVKALCQQGLLPTVLSGSSGGSFVGALVSTHNKHELEKIFDPEYLVHEIKQESQLFQTRVEAEAGNHADRRNPESSRTADTRPDVPGGFRAHRAAIEYICCAGGNAPEITPAERDHLPECLHPGGDNGVRSRAGVYPPVTLSAKNHLGEKQAYLPSRKWVDGSVSDDMPAKRLARLYGVNHYIVSQTNPHVIPFVTDGKKRQDAFSLVKDASVKTARAWYNVGAATLEGPLSLSPTLTRYSTIARSVINQDYVGDINILPSNRFFNPFRLLAYRSVSEIIELIATGEKATWPKIEMIRIQTRISRKLDTILSGFEGPADTVRKSCPQKKGRLSR